MSSDPEAPVDPTRYTGGHVVRNMIYTHNHNNDLQVMTGWNAQSNREYNQHIAPPADERMDKRHPCFDDNSKLVKCSLACPEKARLAARIAECNEDRKQLMTCLTKNKVEIKQLEATLVKESAKGSGWWKLW